MEGGGWRVEGGGWISQETVEPLNLEPLNFERARAAARAPGSEPRNRRNRRKKPAPKSQPRKNTKNAKAPGTHQGFILFQFVGRRNKLEQNGTLKSLAALLVYEVHSQSETWREEIVWSAPAERLAATALWLPA